jgi:P-type Mg2+ transporter
MAPLLLSVFLKAAKYVVVRLYPSTADLLPMEITSSHEPFWAIETQQLFSRLDSSESGLSGAEAKRRSDLLSPMQRNQYSVLKLFANQFKSPIILLLFCSAVLTFSLAYYDAISNGGPFSFADAPDGCIIVLILIASGLLGFWQEWSATDAVAKLLRLIETRTKVLRAGCEIDVPLQAVVPGDVLVLQAGNMIAGDCRLLTAQNLFVNEAALTGESFPAEKHVAVLPKTTSLASRHNSLHMGTYVLSGFGTALVAATSTDTELGKISASLGKRSPESSFERGIRQFGQLLIKIVVFITVVVFAIKVGIQHKHLTDALLVSLALAVGMTPQLLPAVTSVVLAAGASAMAKKQVIIKRLLSIENLGSMTVLCSDKTGTLTEGSIRLQGALDIFGVSSQRVERLAYLNASLQTGFPNPIDSAIRDYGQFDLTNIQKVDEIPYDFVRKRLSVRLETNGNKEIITKGALSQVLACCTHAELPNGSAVSIDSFRSTIDEKFQQMSRDGLRVLGIAIRNCDKAKIDKQDECHMTFVGFLAFADPPKSNAKETISQLRDLGVGLKIVTGDNRVVASAISQRVGIVSPKILTGEDLRNLSASSLRYRVRETDIFAEVEPHQKEQIILALKGAGEVVGYLGDGINDASALHAADVGISVSQAVDVAREAAQVVLLQQDLSVLVEGVREGRKTFTNTLKYIYFAIAANFGYMFSLAVAGLFLSFEPLLASQILLVNLLADFPAMALSTDRVDPEQVQQPRRWDTRFIVRFMLSFGLASSMFDFMTFAAMFYAFQGLVANESAPTFERLFQTGWFVESTLTGLMILMVIRTQRPFFLSRPGRLFLFAEATIAAITLCIPFTPMSTWLGFVSPPPMLLGIAIGITILYGIGMEIVKRLFYDAIRSTPHA